MKVKALLFSAVAMASLAAYAGVPPTTTKVYCGDVTVQKASDKVIVPVYCENPDQPDITAFRMTVTAPEGFTFVQLTKKEATGSGNATTYRDGIVAGAAAEAGLACSANLETGKYILSVVSDEGIGECEEGDPIFYFAVQATDAIAEAKLAAGDYDFGFHAEVSGPAADQSLYGAVEDTNFKVTFNEGTTTGVNDINAKAVAGVKYYNIAGVESNVPFDGVNVVVTTYTDGTKAASKVIK